jgi:acetyl-CoA carboxylase carboxyl transferase subunit alpha
MSLEFEKPILELEAKIAELERYAQESGVNLEEELKALRDRLARLKEETYGHLTRWQRIQIARAPGRPTTLDVIAGVLEGFVELSGDRAFGDDPALVGGLAYFEGQPVVVVE